MKKRTLSLLLCLVMCLTLVPMTAFATGAEEVGGKTLPYFFDFESDFIAAGWTNIDADGDGQDWITGTNNYGAEEWGVEDSRCAISQSYDNNLGAFNADNWLFSPAITIPEGGAIVSWYEQSQDVSYPESYTVYVSETNTSTDTSKMTKIFSGTAANPWNQRSVELEAAEYAGKTVYIAFRHHSYDCYMLDIDNFAVGAEAPAHTHTVTFDANGGSVTPTSAETGTDGKLASLPTPTRSGYSFDGWYTMKEGGTKVDTNTVFTAAATIYAHWSRSFSFAHLPKTGVATITVPEGDYYTGVAAKEAFILYWDENIETDGDFLLFDYFNTYNNGYHSWMITIENGVISAVDGGFTDDPLYIINDIPFYESWDKWVNGTYSAIHTHAFTYTANNGKITATCVDGCDDGYDTNPLTLTLTAPASLVYNGNDKAFTFADGEAAAWTGAGLELPTITYAAKSGSTLTSDKAVDAGSYTVSVTVDTDKTASLDFEITKATPYIKTNPEPTEIELGKKLADSTLVDGYVHISSSDSTEVAGLFEWTNPDTVPGIDDSEVTLYDVTFTPVDTNNYNTVSCQVKITVNHTHNPKLVNGQAPQKGIAGWKDYFECICGERYEDASGSILIPDLAVWKAEGGNGYLAPLTPAKYTVTFNMGNHGTQIDPQTVEEGNNATKPSDPTAEGWTFGGWYVDTDFSAMFDFNTAINANTTIYAKWTENTPDTYTVTFDANGGSVMPTSAVTGADGTLASLPTPTRNGSYSFSGWYTEVSGGTIVDTATVFTADTTIYAKWTQNSGGSSAPTTFENTVADSTHGSVSINKNNARAGEIVTINVNPDQGYTLETITVTDRNGKNIPVTAEDGKYTFTMPASKVTIEATFMEDNSMLNFFVDVPVDTYYYDAVLWAVENGITFGTDDTHFSPNLTCTRAQVVTFLWRAAGSPEVESGESMDDVAAGSYYEKAVAWAIATGITKGTAEGVFSPNAICSRAQIGTFLWRAAGSPILANMAANGPAAGSNPFGDVSADNYYYNAVLWAVANGITNGTTADTFSPSADCTRAQIVTFLYRYMVK